MILGVARRPNFIQIYINQSEGERLLLKDPPMFSYSYLPKLDFEKEEFNRFIVRVEGTEEVQYKELLNYYEKNYLFDYIDKHVENLIQNGYQFNPGSVHLKDHISLLEKMYDSSCRLKDLHDTPLHQEEDNKYSDFINIGLEKVLRQIVKMNLVNAGINAMVKPWFKAAVLNLVEPQKEALIEKLLIQSVNVPEVEKDKVLKQIKILQDPHRGEEYFKGLLDGYILQSKGWGKENNLRDDGDLIRITELGRKLLEAKKIKKVARKKEDPKGECRYCFRPTDHDVCMPCRSKHTDLTLYEKSNRF